MALFLLKRNFSSILEDLWQGYTLEETKEITSNYEINGFFNYLKENNMSIEEALTIYQYSVNSNMMLGLARETATESSIKENFFEDMKDRLSIVTKSNVVEEINKKSRELIENLDFSKKVYELKKEVTLFAKKEGIMPNPLTNAVENMAHLLNAKETISKLEKILKKYELKKDMVLYRAVKSSYLPKKPEEMIGEIIENKHATSTTYDKDGGFVQNKEMDLIYQINVPKNTKGLNIEQLSGYKREKEVLLAGHQLKVKDYHYEGDKIFLECDLIPLEKQFEIEESVDDILLNTPLENQNKQIVDTHLIKEDIFVNLD